MLHVVIRSGHRMSTSHIQPREVRHETAKSHLHIEERPLQIIGSGLAQGMEVQPLDALRHRVSQQVAGHPHQ
jgi:hypothetical protein